MTELQFALRKSVGGYSAGTRCLTVDTTHYPIINVEMPQLVDSDGKWLVQDSVFDIDADMLVELRSRSDIVPATPRSQRISRIGRRNAYRQAMKFAHLGDTDV